ncbi:MAG: hypothetical protein ACO36I_13095, partial [Candidatus Latescibacterota bacterium]
TTEWLRALQPVPYSPDRMAALAPVRTFLAANRNAQVLWIASGLELGNARKFAEGLRTSGGTDLPVRILLADRSPLAAVSATNAPGALEVVLRRAGSDAPSSGVLRAYDLKGLSVGEAPFSFAAGNETKGRFELPIELRNEIARIEIHDENGKRYKIENYWELETDSRERIADLLPDKVLKARYVRSGMKGGKVR